MYLLRLVQMTTLAVKPSTTSKEFKVTSADSVDNISGFVTSAIGG